MLPDTALVSDRARFPDAGLLSGTGAVPTRAFLAAQALLVRLAPSFAAGGAFAVSAAGGAFAVSAAG
ncbi:hypothetical protein, partial [Streptomyces sp. Root1319]|uniref:hypothetical protein n=1 Tax=Streptomyces sp. Root1319 TaxID=1736454 RepID=UPI001A7E252C